MEVSVHIFLHAHGLQWEQSCMYIGCSKVNHVYVSSNGNSRVCTQVVVR
jgi:hypothetical protein